MRNKIFRSQEYNRETKWCSCDVLKGMIFTSFQYNLEGVIESSVKLKFNIPSMEKLTSPVKRKTRSLFFWNDSSRSPEDRDRSIVLIQKILSLKLST